MKKFSLIIAVALVALSAGAASLHTESADTSPALRIYNGYTGTVSIAIVGAGAGSTNLVTLDGHVNTIDGSGSIDTIAEVVTALKACTNASGQIKLAVDSECSLSADSTDGELLDGVYSIAAGTWGEIPWDTSAALFYSVYLPSQTYDPYRTPLTLKTAYGTVTGSGNVTLNVYLGGTLAWSKLLVEGTANEVDLPTSIDIPVRVGEALIVRAARTQVGTNAPTATTGLLGITVGSAGIND